MLEQLAMAAQGAKGRSRDRFCLHLNVPFRQGSSGVNGSKFPLLRSSRRSISLNGISAEF
jgi:hypothetical protein